MEASANSEWQAGRLRLTAFVPVSVRVGDVRKWQDLVGQPPDSSSYRPKMESLEEQGPFEKGELQFNMVPGRIDWLYGAISTTEQLAERMPALGAFATEVVTFRKIVESWLENPIPILRLAVGSELFIPVPDRDAGYEQLAKYVQHAVRVDLNSSDFLYQINRPRVTRSGVEGLRINRLSTWRVIMLRLKMKYTSGGQTVDREGEQLHALHVTTDVNTSPEYGKELPQDRLVTLFRELVELTMEIAEKGDTP